MLRAELGRALRDVLLKYLGQITLLLNPAAAATRGTGKSVSMSMRGGFNSAEEQVVIAVANPRADAVDAAIGTQGRR
jgi:hypothetical protein